MSEVTISKEEYDSLKRKAELLATTPMAKSPIIVGPKEPDWDKVVAAFGAWGKSKESGLAYQKRIRRAWRRS